MSENGYALYWIPREGKTTLTDQKEYMKVKFATKLEAVEKARELRRMPKYKEYKNGSFFYKELETNRFTMI